LPISEKRSARNWLTPVIPVKVPETRLVWLSVKLSWSATMPVPGRDSGMSKV
jgi:hypothetical protein